MAERLSRKRQSFCVGRGILFVLSVSLFHCSARDTWAERRSYYLTTAALQVRETALLYE